MSRNEVHIELRGGDGTELHGRFYEPDPAGVRGAVVLLHGMGEHGGRYRSVADAFVRLGCAVLAYDQRGHGLTPGKRGHAPSIEALTGDAAAALDWMGRRVPGKPLFLYGHSMGGGVALAAALRFRPKLAGLILTSPWLRLAFRPPAVKEGIGRLLGRLAPSLTLSAGLGSGALYRNEAQRAEDQADDLLHHRISAGMYYAIAEAGRQSIAHAHEWRTPTLIVHGTADRITSIEASREAADRMGDSCRFVVWEDGLHELHHDRERDSTIALIAEWTRARL